MVRILEIPDEVPVEAYERIAGILAGLSGWHPAHRTGEWDVETWHHVDCPVTKVPHPMPNPAWGVSGAIKRKTATRGQRRVTLDWWNRLNAAEDACECRLPPHEQWDPVLQMCGCELSGDEDECKCECHFDWRHDRQGRKTCMSSALSGDWTAAKREAVIEALRILHIKKTLTTGGAA